MTTAWDKNRLEALIRDGVEESLTLEYKSAEALGSSDGKKREIAKDTSAFANSAGGTLIYGVKEFDGDEKSHLPEKIDPVDASQFSKEWLEHVISNIRPKIPGISIEPVRISGPDSTETVYVVDIPQGTTAYQATDFRYYRRYNFESVPMADHEIRDVMRRLQEPDIVLLPPERVRGSKELWNIPLTARNLSPITAKGVYIDFTYTDNVSTPIQPIPPYLVPTKDGIGKTTCHVAHPLDSVYKGLDVYLGMLEYRVRSPSVTTTIEARIFADAMIARRCTLEITFDKYPRLVVSDYELLY